MTQYKYRINGKEYEVTINSVSEDGAQVTVNGKAYGVEIVKEEKAEENASPLPLRPIVRKEDKAEPSQADKSLRSPLPGTILAIKVKVGDIVKEGQTVAILEAMKMENEILSEHDGTVTSVNVEKGDSVLEGTVIVSIK
jgi:biotin carboxyl carrier protein